MSVLLRCLSEVVEGRSLSAADAEAVIGVIMGGEASPAQVGALLAALRTKGETVEEVVGAARAMRAHALPVDTSRSPLVDTCGTGGDGASTFSISTATALVVAGTGVAVAKHGNRGASSKFGGADTLEYLGVRIEIEPARMAACLDEVGMAFLFARVCHPAMRHAAPIRAELGIRSIFNMLGPLTNPAAPQYQVVGVGAAEMLPFVAGALGQLGVERALVVHGGDGLDEISLSAATRALVVEGGEAREWMIDASDFGLSPHPREAVVADSVQRSAAMVRDVLAGKAGAPLDFVLANAAAVLWTAGVATDLRSGVEAARESAASGAAAAVLERLVAFTSDGAA